MADMDSSIDQRKRVLLLYRILAEKRRRILTQHALLSYHEEIWKRIHMLLLILSISTNSRNSNRMVARSWRRVIRNTGWWANVWNTYSHARFKKLFRVSRGLFFFILVRIWHVLVRDTVCKEPNTLELSDKSDSGLISSCSDDRLSSSYSDFKLIWHPYEHRYFSKPSFSKIWNKSKHAFHVIPLRKYSEPHCHNVCIRFRFNFTLHLRTSNLRLLPTFAGVLRENIRTRASFTKFLANYISEESLITAVITKNMI